MKRNTESGQVLLGLVSLMAILVLVLAGAGFLVLDGVQKSQVSGWVSQMDTTIAQKGANSFSALAVYKETMKAYTAYVGSLPDLIAVEVPNTHADDKHPEAISIRETLCKRGPTDMFRLKFFGDYRYFAVCKIADGKYKDRWGFQLIHKVKIGTRSVWQELTCYIKGDGLTRDKIIRFLIDSGASSISTNFWWNE